MIRIELGREVSPGVFEYSIPCRRLCGKSRQPLLDACRALKSLGGPTGERAGLFREGKFEPDLVCSVEWGAGKTVSETDAGKIGFRNYRPFELAKVA